jgi:hypothetical protein
LLKQYQSEESGDGHRRDGDGGRRDGNTATMSGGLLRLSLEQQQRQEQHQQHQQQRQPRQTSSHSPPPMIMMNAPGRLQWTVAPHLTGRCCCVL